MPACETRQFSKLVLTRGSCAASSSWQGFSQSVSGPGERADLKKPRELPLAEPLSESYI